MPSCLPAAGAVASGGQRLVSGSFYSGTISPAGGVQLRVAADASGSVYIGVLLGRTSGGITITSGGALTSGGEADGMEMRPGDGYFVPNLMCSGQINNIVVAVPTAISGRARVFWWAH